MEEFVWWQEEPGAVDRGGLLNVLGEEEEQGAVDRGGLLNAFNKGPTRSTRDPVPPVSQDVVGSKPGQEEEEEKEESNKEIKWIGRIQQ
jgi:hypothetical protein